MESRKDNEFLAELLGWSRDFDDNITEGGGNWWIHTDSARYVVATDEQREYHYSKIYWKPNESWEQLMMVVDKIETMNTGLDGLFGSDTVPLAVNIKRLDSSYNNDFMCVIFFDEYSKFKCINKDKKTAVYNTVIEFSKWHQKLK